jgi:hypothetical protein
VEAPTGEKRNNINNIGFRAGLAVEGGRTYLEKVAEHLKKWHKELPKRG